MRWRTETALPGPSPARARPAPQQAEESTAAALWKSSQATLTAPASTVDDNLMVTRDAIAAIVTRLEQQPGMVLNQNLLV